MSAEVSHGRGGAGNIAKDDSKYVDGGVVREGAVGSHGDGAFSTGRGGAANIGDAGKPPGPRHDKEVVPEAAYRPSTEDQDHHTGRGGAGNEVKKKTPEKENGVIPLGLADRLKNKLLSVFKKST